LNNSNKFNILKVAMIEEKKLTPSLEDYLEAILTLEKENRVARVKDIAELLNVQMPSVTGALKTLKQKNLINYEKNSYISLTNKGISVAGAIQDLHSAVYLFLEKILLLPHEEASDQACKIEHIISSETARRLKNCTRFLLKELSKDEGRLKSNWEKILTR